jgi:cyclophilin family peptidyl-prolyl cis-trans isomerase
VVEQLIEKYGDDFRIAYRHFPLNSIHANAQITAEAAEAAGDQGSFWEFHDLLLERQAAWADVDTSDMIDLLVGYADELELDTEQFRADLEDGVYTDRVAEATAAAAAAQISGTPTVFINGVLFPAGQLPLDVDGIDLWVSLLRLTELQYDEPPPQVIDPEKSYQATIETEKGDIVVELFADTAPVNVNSFVFLAQEGWYDGVTFHRVLDGFVAQGGDPSGTGFGYPGYRCRDEITPDRTFDGPGVVSLANSGPNTNGGQFFITYSGTASLNEGFTIIGQVVEGQDVTDSLTRRDPQADPFGPPGDTIIAIVIEER